MRSRPSVKNGVDIAIVAISLLCLLIFIGGDLLLVTGVRGLYSTSLLSAFGSILNSSVVAGVVVAFITVIYVALMLITLARLLNLNLIQLTTRPGPLTLILALLFLNRKDTETDTSRLGLILSSAHVIALLFLPAMLGGRYNVSGVYVIVFLMLGIPLVLLHAFYLPQFQDIIRANQPVIGGYEPYLDVVSGSLIGARPRLPQENKKPFYIGRSNDCHLVLFDDYSVQEYHICIFFDNSLPILQTYAPIFLNGQAAGQGLYPLKPNMHLQVGQSLIVYKV